VSAICGLFDTSGAPVDASIVTTMSLASRYRGPDGIHTWINGNVGLGQLLMATTPEARAEAKPLEHSLTGSVVVFDGRLDNRESLVSQLNVTRARARGISDMELVLLAWLAWGEDCPEKLLGDFAFAIFDGVRRRLFCARDISSNRAFYYCYKAGKLIFGTTVSQVLAHPEVPAEPNEAMVAELLTGLHLSRTESLYRDIQRLPAAHGMRVDSRGVHIKRYWHPLRIRPIRYPRFAEYAAHFEEIFTDAVRCRLRSDNGVAITLSGGKDSPSIAGMAQTLFRQEGAGRTLTSYSLTYPGRPCDESALIADVVAMWDLDAHDVPFETFSELPDWGSQSQLTRDLPEFPTFSALSGAQRHSVSKGRRVWLSGTGSQSVSGGNEFPYLGLVREGNFNRLASEFGKQKKSFGTGYALWHLLACLAWPMLPRSSRRQVQAARHSMPVSGFLSDSLLHTVGFKQRFAASLDAHDFDDLAEWAVHQSAFAAERAYLQESYDRLNALNGIEERHPFEDRRLVEFALGVPSHVKSDHVSHKRLLLSMGERLLPPSVRANTVKFEAGCLFLDMLCRESVRERLESSRSAELGWVDKQKAIEVFDRLSQNFRNNPKAGAKAFVSRDYRELVNLWSVVAIESWLKGAPR